MKHIFTLLFLFVSVTCLFAQSAAKSDLRSTAQATVIRIDGSTPSSWIKGDNDASTTVSTSTSGSETVNFSSTADGIFITILSGTNKIKLFALTGQLLFNGDLTQGRFLIQVRKGIYFLKINNKSFKVICK
ncbi:MAG: T9SS type A sorting domain-containing protein [Paludibacter sp.]